jgi:hypothetical protein
MHAYTVHITSCRSLDYDSASHQYLLAGRVDTSWGVYVLDTAFNVVSELNITRGGIRLARLVDKAYFIDHHKILIQCKPHVYEYEIGYEPVELWQNVQLFVLSPDRLKILSSTGYEDDMILQLHDLQDGSTAVLNVNDKDIIQAAFSPDGQHLALLWSTHNIGNMCHIMIYDIATGELHRTNCGGYGELLWVPQNILSEYRVPFGRNNR